MKSCDMEAARLYPRWLEKVVGFSVLAGYLVGFATTGQIAFPSILDARLVVFLSFFNVISHMAVIWNLLNDAYVISILVGVGYDLACSALYMQYTSTSSLLGMWLLGDFLLHLRALFLYTSLDRMQSVVKAASNNLKSIPGPFWGRSHLCLY